MIAGSLFYVFLDFVYIYTYKLTYITTYKLTYWLVVNILEPGHLRMNSDLVIY